MEDTKYEEREQIASDIKCQNIVRGTGNSRALSPGPVQRPEIVGSHHANPKFASLTPEKPNESSCKMDKKEVAELPERCRILAEYFDRMICSLRLLTLRKKMPIFHNISRQVEILTGRRFSYRHLAQIKYILPEAVQTDKVLIHDKNTLCMKPDIKITLLFDVIEGHYQQSIFMALQQIFTSRLLNFSAMHPENCEIPEAEMPEPFNGANDAKIVDAVPVDLSTECQRGSLETELLNASHLFPSFRRHFSQSFVAEPEKKASSLAPQVLTSGKNEYQTDEDIGSRQQDVSPDNKKPSSEHQDVSPAIYSKSLTISNPVQLTHSANCVSSTACEITPSKVASEPNDSTIQTPAQLTPKRSVPSCDNKLKIMTGQKWAACNISTKRFLDFSLVDEGNALNSPIDEINQSKLENNIIPQKITRGLSVDDSLTCSVALFQKAEASCCSKEQKAKTTDLALLQQVSASSSKSSNLISLIYQIFQSVKFRSITKEELIHKIIMNNCDVVERREVEDQIDLLEKLVPDWICRNLAPTGDLLYNVKKVSDLNAVRERLSHQVAELPRKTITIFD